jgi:DNA-binding transcriptional ArsR family regulator
MLYNTGMDAFAALADPTRRAIVELLAQRGELAASAIAAHFPVSAPAISQHLKVLREADVLLMEKRAQQRIYRVNPQAMQEVQSWAGRMAQQWQRRFNVLDELLREEMAKQASAAGSAGAEGIEENEERG